MPPVIDSLADLIQRIPLYQGNAQPCLCISPEASACSVSRGNRVPSVNEYKPTKIHIPPHKRYKPVTTGDPSNLSGNSWRREEIVGHRRSLNGLKSYVFWNSTDRLLAGISITWVRLN
jgi:hypothetical protein